MGRPPCCDKVAVKKGPWTPEEDIILLSYIQEHGPGNWRSVSKNAGLLRCSKSCRLRWTNYLRPGIRRGNFTPHEEGMIIHLQSLLGNRWAAIASYLPQRTDNDIKNYWNTHLKKRIKKFQSALDSHSIFNSCISQLHSKGCSGTRSSSLRSCATYALSTENISRLLEGWMKPTPKDSTSDYDHQSNGNTNVEVAASSHSVDPKLKDERCDLITHDELENLLSFDNLNNIAWETSSADFTTPGYLSSGLSDGPSSMAETKERSFLGKWLFDEATAHVDDLIDLHVDCSSASIF